MEENKELNNQIKPEVVVIVVTGVLYILGLFAMLKEITTLSIICFVAVSSLLTLLCVRLNKSEDIEETETIDPEVFMTLEQNNTELKQRVRALENELEERTKEISKANFEANTAENNWKLKYDDLSQKIGKQDLEAFLPPIGENEQDIETIDIISIASETIEELKSFAEEAGIEVGISSADKSLLVKGSTSRMRIMFRNIIDNSIKYMNRSGRLLITISSIDDDIFIVLKDNGAGLSEDETEHVFELNYQGSNRISGNGLGLSQAKAIVDYYGGTIYAKSHLDKGMAIYIQLPTT